MSCTRSVGKSQASSAVLMTPINHDAIKNKKKNVKDASVPEMRGLHDQRTCSEHLTTTALPAKSPATMGEMRLWNATPAEVRVR